MIEETYTKKFSQFEDIPKTRRSLYTSIQTDANFKTILTDSRDISTHRLDIGFESPCQNQLLSNETISILLS